MQQPRAWKCLRILTIHNHPDGPPLCVIDKGKELQLEPECVVVEKEQTIHLVRGSGYGTTRKWIRHQRGWTPVTDWGLGLEIQMQIVANATVYKTKKAVDCYVKPGIPHAKERIPEDKWLAVIATSLDRGWGRVHDGEYSGWVRLEDLGAPVRVPWTKDLPNSSQHMVQNRGVAYELVQEQPVDDGEESRSDHSDDEDEEEDDDQWKEASADIEEILKLFMKRADSKGRSQFNALDPMQQIAVLCMMQQKPKEWREKLRGWRVMEGKVSTIACDFGGRTQDDDEIIEISELRPYAEAFLRSDPMVMAATAFRLRSKTLTERDFRGCVEWLGHLSKQIGQLVAHPTATKQPKKRINNAAAVTAPKPRKRRRTDEQIKEARSERNRRDYENNGKRRRAAAKHKKRRLL